MTNINRKNLSYSSSIMANTVESKKGESCGPQSNKYEERAFTLMNTQEGNIPSPITQVTNPWTSCVTNKWRITREIN
jgi:hypothetical protein